MIHRDAYIARLYQDVAVSMDGHCNGIVRYRVLNDPWNTSYGH